MPKGPTFPYKTGNNIEPFDEKASVTIGAGASATIIEWTAPTGMVQGYITLFGHGIDNVALWPTAIFQIQLNGVPVKDYNDIRDQLGEFRDPQEIGPVVIKPAMRVTVVAINGGAAGGLFAARCRGFYDWQGAQ